MGFGKAVENGVLAKVIAKVAEQAPNSTLGKNYLLQNSVAKKKEDEKKKMAYGGKVHKMKKGGSVKKCKRDGIAVRGKTRAGR